MVIDELIDLREYWRINKSFNMSDNIRNELDLKSVFVFDTKEGQVVYHESKGVTRKQLTNRLDKSKQSNKRFDAWLYSMNNKKC